MSGSPRSRVGARRPSSFVYRNTVGAEVEYFPTHRVVDDTDPVDYDAWQDTGWSVSTHRRVMPLILDSTRDVRAAFRELTRLRDER